MAMKLSQSLKQTQTLMMTPQLQQAIKLLTLTHLEMTTVIAQEMVENPMLEELGGETSVEDLKGESREEMDNREATADDFHGPELVEGGKSEIDWEKYIETFNSNSSAPPPSMVGQTSLDDVPNYENMVSKGQTLPEYLEWQLRMENLSEQEWSLAYPIIHNIDEDGYLAIDFDELLAQTNMEREDAEEILSMIQKLDPVGCGSRNLTECLLAQARVLEMRSPMVELIINKYLTELHKKDYAAIEKATGFPREKIKDAELIILGFNPKPGRLVSPEAPEYVVPDVYVYEIGGEWVVSLNDDGVPRLKVSNLYRSMLKNKETAVEAQDFVQDKLRAAMWLIKSIENRQRTILKVANAIVKHQPQFFRRGSEALVPMTLKDIAGEIGMHESTVSRVTTNKYMHTPLGIFEMKFFFNTGVGGKDGGIEIASESLKLKIKELIENENPKRPLSDDKIAQMLEAKGINVARRTVAKYREMMNILPSSKRKKVG